MAKNKWRFLRKINYTFLFIWGFLISTLPDLWVRVTVFGWRELVGLIFFLMLNSFLRLAFGFYSEWKEVGEGREKRDVRSTTNGIGLAILLIPIAAGLSLWISPFHMVVFAGVQLAPFWYLKRVRSPDEEMNILIKHCIFEWMVSLLTPLLVIILRWIIL